MTTTTTTQTRDEIRAKIFSTRPKTLLVENFFGTTIELRQPTLEVALTQREESEADRVYLMLTEYAYVPGTEEKVFSFEDVDNIKQLPFGGDFTNLVDKVNELLGIKVEEVEKAIKEAEKSA